MPISQVIALLLVFVGIIIALIGFIFRSQVSRIDMLGTRLDNIENLILSDISTLKNDILWIKNKLEKL